MRAQWKPPRCKSGKVAFRSQGKAQVALERIVRDNAQAVVPHPASPCRAYRCACGAWHLTSQPER